MTFGAAPITPGSGRNVAVDTIASNDYQRTKIVDATEGSTVGLAIDADYGALVEPRTRMVRVAVAPTLSVAAYAAGDNMGGELTIPGAVRAAGGYARLRYMTVWSKVTSWGAGHGRFQLLFADRAIGANGGAGKADQAVFDPDDADLPAFTGGWEVALSDAYTFSSNALKFGDDQASYAYSYSGQPSGFPIDVLIRANTGTDAYLYLVAADAIDLVTNSDLGFVFFLEQL